jgi:hypothetical protein
MMIGVGVEGPSDRVFWDKVLHKHFKRAQFDIHNMKNRDKLIRETPRLLATFQDLHYSAGLILVDRDRDRCVAAVLNRFERTIRTEARKPPSERYIFVCLAVPELEAWFLADQLAVAAVLPDSGYVSPPETGNVGAEGLLKKLWRKQHGKVAFNKIDFAKRIAPKFNPTRASSRSASFQYFWQNATLITRR